MIYNGMEAGDSTESGAPALFADLKVWWQAAQMRPQFPLFYDFIIPFRKQQPALLHGETVWLHNSDESHVVSYLRRPTDEEFLVTVNLSDTLFRGSVEVPPGAWEEVNVPQTPVQGSTGVSGVQSVKLGQTAIPALSLGAFGFRIFYRSLKPASSPNL